MRTLLLLAVCSMQSCITGAMWASYGAEEKVPVTSVGQARLVAATVDPDGPRIFADVELLDDQETLRTAFEGVRTTLALLPGSRPLPGSLLRTGQVSGCRLDEVRPYLAVHKGEKGETVWKMRMEWRGQCARIPANKAPPEYAPLEVLRENELDGARRDVVDRVWNALPMSGLQGAYRASREAVGWLDSDGELLPKPGAAQFPSATRLPAFLVVRLRTDESAVAYVEIPSVLLAHPESSKLSGGPDSLAWSYRDEYAAEPRALAPPGLGPLATSHRVANFSYEHVHIVTQKNEGGFWWRLLLTPVTVVLDIPFVIFWLWLDEKLDPDKDAPAGGC